VKDLINHEIDAYEQLENCVQKKGQTVQAFITYIESLKHECNLVDKTTRKNQLFHKLNKNIQDIISNSGIMLITMNDLISVIAQIKENLKNNKHSLAMIRRIEA
jgi:hypothetical protein